MQLQSQIPGSARRVTCVFTLLVMLAGVFGCNSPHRHTTDSRLQKIDEMLNADLPKGSTKQYVVFYLNSRGFGAENSRNPEGVVATVSHIDPETLQPAAARVFFRFDAGDTLTTYDLQPADDVLPMH